MSLLAGVLVYASSSRPSSAAVENFPDGTEVEVTIDSPADGSPVADGTATLEGTARVGAGEAPPDTSLVVVYDLSGSTLDPAGGDCGGDVNGDGRSNTILDCEIAAMEALEQTAAGLGSVAEMGVVLFELGSAAADVQPASGAQRLTEPGADLNGNGTTDIAEVVRSSRWRSGFFSADATVSLFTRYDAGTGNGGTNYSAGLSRACETLAATSQPNRTIVFLSDGAANRGTNVANVLPCGQPATVHSVAVGANSTCTSNPSGLGSLQDVADLTDGTCTEVVSPEELPDILSGIISPEITGLTLSVNGGPDVDISSETSMPLPAKGPAPIDWTWTLDGLVGPVDEVCVTVTAGRGDEVVRATECIELISDRPPVADAGPDRTVDEGSLVELDGTGSFDPDGDPLSYEWEVVAQDGAPIVLTSTTEPIASFIAFDDGTYDLRLTVSDGRTAVPDEVTITVANVAPTAEALAEPASEGGIALITASFTDPGILDTHTATIDWGDGSPTEDVAISAQGNGWGSLYATHVYGDAGSFTATITVADDDGGIDTVESVAVEVADSLALWANSETDKLSFDATGGGGLVQGLTHSNGDLRVRGADKTFDGRVEYAGELDTQNVTFTEPPVEVAPAPYPVSFDVADYAPGGPGAVDAGAAYFDMSDACDVSNGTWDPTGPLASGLYYAPCDVKLNADALAGTVTLAATGNIQVSGSSADFEPFIDGLLFLSGSADDRAIQTSSSNSTYLGYLFAGTGRVDLAGAGNTYLCGILADRIDLADSGLTIRASDCIRPERTVAPPVLVPELDLGVDVTPADATPGDTVSTETTLTNAGSLLLVPGIVGLENLGDAPVTVTSIGLGIEYLPVGGSWTPLAEAITVASTPNPAPGVTYGPDFAGTVIDPDGLATWGAEMQVFLPPATVDYLLDETQVAAVRNTFTYELDNPTSEPVRGLFRFGNDFSDELRALSGDLTDLTVVQTSTDGTADLVDAADLPALASLAPGQSVSVSDDAVVPVPDPRGVLEPVDAYLARLASLDGTELAGSAFALASGGVGTVLGPFDFDTVTRRLPVVGLDLTGPELVVAGATATYGVGLRNTGSGDAPLVTTELVVDGAAVATDAATSLPAGGIDDSTVSVAIPPERPVGFLEALATTSWTDANGNDYGDVEDEVSTEIGSPPDLSALLADAVEVDADNSGLPSAGDTIRYTATVTNRGTTPATGVVFHAPIDPQSDLVGGSVTTSLGAVTGGNAPGDTTVTIDAGNVPAMSSLEIGFDVVILPGTVTLTVQGSVASDDAPAFLTDDPGAPGLEDPTVTTVVETPPSLQAILVGRLAVDADGDQFIGPGDTVEYSLQLNNSGLTSATGVTATLTPDPGTALVAGSVDTDATVVDGNDPGDTTLVVSFGEVPGLNQWMVGFEVTVDDPLPDGTDEIVTQATITSNELADVLSDDPSVGGTADPTALSVVTATGGGGGGDTTGPAPTFADGAVGPPDGTVATTPLDITLSGVTPPAGTTIASWEVVAHPANGDPAEGITLASGTGDPPTGPIATFDPTVVSNGTWVIQVSATDSDGGVGTAQTSVIVDGALKLGRYAVTYADSQVSVAGIPLTVERTYDTVARTESGDFGYGWSLDVANFEVSTNRVLGEGPWSAESCGAGLVFVPLCFSADGPRLVNVTWPTGRVETFELAPTGNTFFPIFMSAEYEPRPGVTSALKPVPGDELGGLGSDGHMHEEAFGYGPLYDPQQFLLEASDGTEYLLDKDHGLLRATDRYGNTVTYSDTGIVSSLGPALTFVRDAEGRITSLTEPGGDTVTYTYDAAGDLVSVVDQAGDATTFTYDTGHYLSVIDDEGPGPYRTLNYGPDGRLASITDAEGNTTAITVDVDARTQVVTAPDGRSTRLTTFDDRGNALQVDHVYDGVSHVSSLTYDSEDRVTSRTDPLGNTWRAAYDVNGNLTSYEDPTGAVTTYEYGAFDLPVAITDATGAARSFEYDDVGNLVAVDHPDAATSGSDLGFGSLSTFQTASGGRETFTYDSAGNVLTRTDALGSTWTWRYDGHGNVAEVTDPLGAATTYTYDAQGRMLSQTTPDAATWTYTYDAIGNLTVETDPIGRTTTWEYDERDNATAVIDNLGNRKSYTYDDLGNLTSRTDQTGRGWTYQYDFGRVTSQRAPDGGITTFAYDAAGRIERIVDPLGRATTYGYDDAGRWTTTASPFGDGGTATSTYELDAAGRTVGVIDGTAARWGYERDDVGRITATVDPLGNRRSTTFDNLGRVLATSDPLGNTTAYTYDAAGQVIAVTAPDGGVTTYEYDDVGNVTVVRDALGRRTSFAYDAMYRAVSATDAVGDQSTTTYDLSGRVLSHTTFGGVSTEYTYDARGLVASTEDALGNRVGYAYDAAGRQVSSTDARGNETTYGYDSAGRLATTADPLGGVTTIEFDLAGQPVAIVEPSGDRRLQSYDDAGQLVTQTDPLGRSWTFDHDEAGRQVSATDPRGVTVDYDHDAAGRPVRRTSPSDVTTYAYDAAGRRVTMTDPTGTTTWRYDANGRIAAVEAPAGDVTYDYDLTGQVVGMTQPEGVVTYGYDERGFVDQVEDWNGAVVGVRSDGDGRITGLTRPNGIETDYDYDAAGRLASVEHTEAGVPLATYDYVLDPNGNRTQVAIDDPVGARTERYAYDQLNRIVSADYGSGITETYDYDANGNRTRRVVSGGASPGTTTYSYDAAQQLISITDPDGSASRTYDSAGNLLADGLGSSFTWDAHNRLTTASVGGVTESYVHDGDHLRVEIDGVDQLWDRVDERPRLISAAGSGAVHLGGQVHSEHDGATTSWPLADALGSVRAQTDVNGIVISSSAYSAYGEVTAATGSSPLFGFAGQQTDATGLVHMRARTYDPATGRFLSVDSVQPNAPGTQGWNLYGYANGNPTTLVDPGGNLAAVEYASLARNAVLTQAAVRMLGLCVKGIVEGVAFGLLFAETFGYDYAFEWEWALVDCAIEIMFAGFGPNPSSSRPRPPRPEPPTPKPDAPRPRTPESPPGPRTPDGPNAPRPRDPDAPNRPRDPESPNQRPRECNSFVPGTGVLLADGSTKPIEEVRLGDVVWAADPLTGEAGPRRVIDLITGHGDKVLVDLVVDGDTVVATAEHPFWVDSEGAWVDAEDLEPGDLLLGDDGVTLLVDDVDVRLASAQTVHNLTVEGLHTYFVVAGEDTVLNHNQTCDAGAPDGRPDRPTNTRGEPYPDVTDPRTGKPVADPPEGLEKVPRADRVDWGAQQRGDYIKEWYDRGYDTPPGGWDKYDVHHIVPREYGGTNAFDNLVPVERTVHQQQFNPWWAGY